MNIFGRIVTEESKPLKNNLNNMNTYTFHRVEGFYPVQLNNDQEAIANAKINEGTICVRDLDSNIIWSI